MTDELMKRVERWMDKFASDWQTKADAKSAANILLMEVCAAYKAQQAALTASQQREAAAQEEIKRLREQLSIKENHHKLDRERLRKAREVLDKIARHNYAGAGKLAKKGLENEG